MSDLLGCPFCGGEAEIERAGTPRVSTVYACTECGCRLETGEEHNHGSQWNRRTAAEQVQAPSIPRAKNCGRYLAECNDGRLLYLNHANTWQECPNFIRSALTGASAVGEAAPFEQSGLYGEYTPVTIGPSPATHAESLLAEAVGMLERVPGALNGMFSAGMEEREGGSARRQERYAKAGDALKAEIPAFLATLKEKQDADA